MKNKSIILMIVIILVLILSITGVTLYFTNKSIIQKDETNINNTESNNEDEAINHGIQDNPDEDNITNVISTPNENDENTLTNMHATP